MAGGCGEQALDVGGSRFRQPPGSGAIRAAVGVIAGLEARLRMELGSAGYGRLRAALARIAPHREQDIQPRL